MEYGGNMHKQRAAKLLAMISQDFMDLTAEEQEIYAKGISTTAEKRRASRARLRLIGGSEINVVDIVFGSASGGVENKISSAG